MFFAVLQHARIGALKLRCVKGIAKALGRLFNFFLGFLLYLGTIVFYQHICTEAFFRIFIVYQRVIEGIYVAGGFPDGRVHQDGGVYPYDILVELHHRLPPILFDVVLQLGAVLSIVIHGGKPVINL